MGTKATIRNEDAGKSISVQFNPTTYGFSRSVKWSSDSAAKQGYPRIGFDCGEADNLSVELLLDESESSSSINSKLKDLYDLSTPTVKVGGNATEKRPPLVVYEWGDFRFAGVLEKVDAKLLLFDENGQPKRATVSLSLKGRAFSQAVTADEFFAGAAD